MSNKKENHFSFSAILLGTIASLAILITCGLFAIAIATTFVDKTIKDPSPNILILMSLGVLLLILLSFFAAAYIANFCASHTTARSFIWNSVGVWALLTMIFSTGCLMSLLAINFPKINTPYFVTDVQIMKLNAVTRIEFPKREEKQTAEQRRENQLKNIITWLSFVSVFLGLLASLTGGYYAEQSNLQKSR